MGKAHGHRMHEYRRGKVVRIQEYGRGKVVDGDSCPRMYIWEWNGRLLHEWEGEERWRRNCYTHGRLVEVVKTWME